METDANSNFGSLLRHWREARRYSQLDLALEANVSSKHVSFLETGRNQPSRQMIIRLSNAMDVPLRDRNLMLSAAGFANAYAESPLDAPEVSQADDALNLIMEKHEPYPVIVVDGDWNVVKQNRGSARLAELFLGSSQVESLNAFEVLFSEQGLQPFVENWESLSSVLLMRLFRETLTAAEDSPKLDLYRRIAAMPATPRRWRTLASQLPSGPTINLTLVKDELRASFFTTVTTFGTPQDVTLQELRIESYFPTDETTRALCASWLD